MAPLAALLAADGHRVTGSDAPLYPPMSTLLASVGIRPFASYDAGHLSAELDLVVIGNAVPGSNVEAVECERLGLPRLSMPEALARFFLADRRSLVVAGTHGKTTTTAMAAFVYTAAGRDPGFLVGGVPIDLEVSFRRGGGERFVVEGDEYNAAYFDRGAKFLHYRPETAIVTSVEHDHADLYPTPEAFRAAFRQLVKLIPASGFLVACGDTSELRQIAEEAGCAVVYYGEGRHNDVRFATAPIAIESGMQFEVGEKGDRTFPVRLGVWGAHNATNALAVWAAARHDGIEPREIAAALARFRGVRRRQEVVGSAGDVVVVDDFAHHPTAVGKTLAALAARFPSRRLLAAFEPRSLTAGRAFFLDGYRTSFRGADRVFLAPIYHRDRLAAEERLDLESLADDLSRAGTPTVATASIDALEALLVAESRAGDVIVTMSSGSFSGLPTRLVRALAERRGELG